MKIIIHPKAKKALIAIMIIAVLTIAFFVLRHWFFTQPEKSETAIAPDAQAAVDAVTAFYTLDYTASPELWVSNMCTLTTDKGCNAIRSFYAPTVQTLVKKLQIHTGCTALPVQLVEDDDNIHIWQVKVTLDHPWAGLDNPTQDVFIEVAKVHDRWFMNRILFEHEIERFTTPLP